MAAKRRRMTQKEKQERAQAKKRLQEKGIIPPDKPRLNRKKFIEEAMSEWNDRLRSIEGFMPLTKAVGYVLCQTENGRISKEAVGAAKVLKIAVRLSEFQEKLEKEGKTKYKLLEEYDYIKDILDA